MTAAFVAAAFELAPNSFDRVSAPIAGQDDVYVIYLEKEIAPRVPSFDATQCCCTCRPLASK